jgi:hypothetical protein
MPIPAGSIAHHGYPTIDLSSQRIILRETRAPNPKASGPPTGRKVFSKGAGTLLGLIVLLPLPGCSDKTEEKLPPAAPASKTSAIVPAETPRPMDPTKSDAAPALPPAPNFATSPPDQMSSLAIVNGAKCSIDSINKSENNDGWSIRRGTVINVGGWILDSATNTTSDWAVLRLGLPDQNAHFYYFLTATRGERPDLVQAFGPGPGPKMAAFSLIAATDGLPYGSYKLAVLHQPAAAAQLCELSKTLRIEP